MTAPSGSTAVFSPVPAVELPVDVAVSELSIARSTGAEDDAAGEESVGAVSRGEDEAVELAIVLAVVVFASVAVVKPLFASPVSIVVGSPSG